MWKNDFNSVGDYYDYAEFTLPTAQTDYDVKTNQANLFSKVKLAGRVVIQTDQTLGVKLNNTSASAVTLDPMASPMELVKQILTSNIFLTNTSGSTANLRIWLFV